MSEYVNCFDETKVISFMIKDYRLTEAYNAVWGKVSNLMKIGLDSGPVYDDKYIKTKIKSYNGRINANFHGSKIQKKGVHCVYLPVILLNSVVKIGKNYYLQVFLEECKYIKKEYKMKKFVNDELELDSPDI